jgi:hypothetical protein
LAIEYVKLGECGGLEIRFPASTHGIEGPFKKPAFGIGDAHDQLTLIVCDGVGSK